MVQGWCGQCKPWNVDGLSCLAYGNVFPVFDFTFFSIILKPSFKYLNDIGFVVSREIVPLGIKLKQTSTFRTNDLALHCISALQEVIG